MSKKYFYPVIFEPEEVGVSVYVPDIPGCNTQGDSLEEALEMVQEVIGLMLEGKKPEEYPQASKPNEINLEGNQFVMMVAFDKLAYDKKYNAKAVKKTLSIPAWLNKAALDKGIGIKCTLIYRSKKSRRFGEKSPEPAAFCVPYGTMINSTINTTAQQQQAT